MSHSSARAEAAPNSYTGSGRCMFPCNDGFLSSPSGGVGRIGVPETSPCHRQAKQDGELDPRRVTSGCRELSRGIETSRSPVRQPGRIGSVRSRLCKWAASAGPVTFENPRSPARRPIQADEVEPSPQRSLRGIASQILTPRLRSLFGASVRRTARHAGPRVVQLLFMIGISTIVG